MLELLEERIGSVVLLRPQGAFDKDHAPEVENWAEERLQGGDRFLLLHCGKVPCFDSMGLEILLSITRAASSRGARFALAHLSQDAALTLRVTRLDGAIEHHLSVEDAIRAMRGVTS